jgi:surface protein
MFYYAASFNQPIGGWNTIRVTDMYAMFALAESFNQPIGEWDTSQVENIGVMFYHADSFNQPIGGWDTSQVTDMGYMFAHAASFNQDLNNWVVNAVTWMRSMFFGAAMFNGDITTWKIGKVENLGDMFHSAIHFDQDITHWRAKSIFEAAGNVLERESRNVVFTDVSAVAGMFYNATAWLAKFERIPGTERMYKHYSEELGELVPDEDYDYGDDYDLDYTIGGETQITFANHDWRVYGPSELWRLKLSIDEDEGDDEPLLGTVMYNGQEVPEWFLAFASFIFALFIVAVVVAGVKSLFCSRPKMAQYTVAPPPAQVVYRV